MFPKSYRLPLPIKKQKPIKTFSSPHFLLKIFENKVGHNRFGTVIANRAVKKSTRRHFWKRRIMDFFKGWPNLNKDFLVIVSPMVEEADPAIIQLELQNVLRKIAQTSNL